MQHHHIADAHDEVTASFFRKQRRERFLFFLKLGELYFDQFVPVQFLVNHAKKTFAQASLADFKRGVHGLRRRLEFADLGIGQWFEHEPRSLSVSGKIARGESIFAPRRQFLAQFFHRQTNDVAVRAGDFGNNFLAGILNRIRARLVERLDARQIIADLPRVQRMK